MSRFGIQSAAILASPTCSGAWTLPHNRKRQVAASKMKHCPQCNQAYTDETLQFCRVDGALLVSDQSPTDESSATRILPAPRSSEPGPTKVLQTETAQSQATTSALDGTASAAPPSGEVAATRAVSGKGSLVSNVRSRKAIAVVALGALVIALAIAGYLYFTRSSRAAIESIAVLPCANTNGDPNTEYLSDGIPECIISSLSQLPNLKVMSRNSVFHYKGKDMDAQAVAKELKVQAVLTGRVTQRGDGLSISVELINAQDNSQIWGQQYNRKLADV